MRERRWRVGELAGITGVTVRALHHYEQAGLLTSAGRSSGDHRLYDEAGVERLYRIRALRGLGLSLVEIRKIIDDGSALPDLLRAHLAHLEAEVERVTTLRDRLRSITNAASETNTDALLATLEAMSRVERHGRARRRHGAGNGAEARWRTLGQALRACMEAGDAPSSKRVRVLAAQARASIEAFADGDARVVEALARLRAVDPPRNLAGWDPELTRYLDRALAALAQE